MRGLAGLHNYLCNREDIRYPVRPVSPARHPAITSPASSAFGAPSGRATHPPSPPVFTAGFGAPSTGSAFSPLAAAPSAGAREYLSLTGFRRELSTPCPHPSRSSIPKWISEIDIRYQFPKWILEMALKSGIHRRTACQVLPVTLRHPRFRAPATIASLRGAAPLPAALQNNLGNTKAI